MPAYQPTVARDAVEGLPLLPIENVHPYHVVVFAAQECPTPSGVPRGLGGGLMKGVGLQNPQALFRREKEGSGREKDGSGTAKDKEPIKEGKEKEKEKERDGSRDEKESESAHFIACSDARIGQEGVRRRRKTCSEGAATRDRRASSY